MVIIFSITTPGQALGRDQLCYAFPANNQGTLQGKLVLCLSLLVLTVSSLWDILCLQPKRETEANEDST